MKKTILLTVLLFATVQFTFSQNTIAKLKFEEAEEAYTNNNFELTLNKLKEVVAILKSTNPRILYLQILAEYNLIKTDPYNDFLLLVATKKQCNKYLTEYDNIPNNENKFKDIYKISEALNLYPNNLQEFNKNKADEEARKLKEANDKQKLVPIMEYARKYHHLWKPNLTVEEFKSYNGTISKYYWSSYEKTYYRPGAEESYPEGPFSYKYNSLGKVSQFHVVVFSRNNSKASAKEIYENGKKGVSIVDNYFFDNGESFTISIPKSQNLPNDIEYYITTEIVNKGKLSAVLISFHVDKIQK